MLLRECVEMKKKGLLRRRVAYWHRLDKVKLLKRIARAHEQNIIRTCCYLLLSSACVYPRKLYIWLEDFFTRKKNYIYALYVRAYAFLLLRVLYVVYIYFYFLAKNVEIGKIPLISYFKYTIYTKYC